MSNASAIAIIVGANVGMIGVSNWALDRVTMRATEIIHGVSAGMPLSQGLRWMLTFNSFLPLCTGMMLGTLINAVCMYYIGSAVGDSPVRWVAYAAVVFDSFSSLQWLGGSLVTTLYIRGLLAESSEPA